MSVKKIGQGGEYLYFPVKKKFYSVVFFEIKIVFVFAGFCFQNFTKSKSILSYILSALSAFYYLQHYFFYLYYNNTFENIFSIFNRDFSFALLSLCLLFYTSVSITKLSEINNRLTRKKSIHAKHYSSICMTCLPTLCFK